MHPVLALTLFAAGVVVVVWSTERFLEGLVGLAVILGIGTFAISAMLSGFEAENVAVGVAAGAEGLSSLALGTVFGGCTFVVCVALGLGAIISPLRVTLPRTALAVLFAAPVIAGLGVISDSLQRVAGIILLAAFAGSMWLLLRSSRGHVFFESEALEEVEQKRPTKLRAAVLTAVGLATLGVGGEMVARGASGLIAGFSISPMLMGMVIGPAAIEAEEVIRQAVPARKGHPEVSAGNLIGTALYFVLFNLGLIAVITPVKVQPLIRSFDWPFTVAVTGLATLYLARGGVSRWQGTSLLAAYGLYVAAHLALG